MTVSSIQSHQAQAFSVPIESEPGENAHAVDPTERA
jgi:hypothetical protein